MTARRRLYEMVWLVCLLVQVLAFGLVPASHAHASPRASGCCGMAMAAGAPCAMTGQHDAHRHGTPCCHAHGAPSTITLPASLHPVQGVRFAVMRLPVTVRPWHGAGADWLPPRRPPRSIGI